MRPLLAAVLALLIAAPSLHAQSLRSQFAELFAFGSLSEPLLVLAPADVNNPGAGTVTNTAFQPSSAQANSLILSFLTNWVSGNVANIPIGTTSGGPSFVFEGGVPVEQPAAMGPIYAEGARSSGYGRVVAGANISGIRFNAIRGVPLNDMRLNFTRADVGSGAPGASDVLEVRLGLDLDVTVASLFMTAGVSDRVDVGLVVPFVRADLRGSSQAQVLPLGSLAQNNPQVNTFLAGTANNPVLASSKFISGSATGIGDVAGRVKVNLMDGQHTAFAVAGDVRFPTGNADDLLGTGDLAVRGLGAFSGRWGNFSPHLNIGYLYWDSDAVNDAFLATVGFDQVVAPWVSFAASLVSELQVGESVYQLPDPVTITTPITRTIDPAEIPDMRDDAVSVSLGMKFAAPMGARALLHSMIPVSVGGPRPDLAWTLGVEYPF